MSPEDKCHPLCAFRSDIWRPRAPAWGKGHKCIVGSHIQPPPASRRNPKGMLRPHPEPVRRGPSLRKPGFRDGIGAQCVQAGARWGRQGHLSGQPQAPGWPPSPPPMVPLAPPPRPEPQLEAETPPHPGRLSQQEQERWEEGHAAPWPAAGLSSGLLPNFPGRHSLSWLVSPLS